jgi:hypothetical protein
MRRERLFIKQQKFGWNVFLHSIHHTGQLTFTNHPTYMYFPRYFICTNLMCYPRDNPLDKCSALKSHTRNIPLRYVFEVQRMILLLTDRHKIWIWLLVTLTDATLSSNTSHEAVEEWTVFDFFFINQLTMTSNRVLTTWVENYWGQLPYFQMKPTRICVPPGWEGSRSHSTT